MDSHSGSISDSISRGEHGTWQIAIIMFWGLALLASVVASVAIGYQSVFAAGLFETTDCVPGCVASGDISYSAKSEVVTQPDLCPGQSHCV